MLRASFPLLIDSFSFSFCYKIDYNNMEISLLFWCLQITSHAQLFTLGEIFRSWLQTLIVWKRTLLNCLSFHISLNLVACGNFVTRTYTHCFDYSRVSRVIFNVLKVITFLRVWHLDVNKIQAVNCFHWHKYLVSQRRMRERSGDFSSNWIEFHALKLNVWFL